MTLSPGFTSNLEGIKRESLSLTRCGSDPSGSALPTLSLVPISVLFSSELFGTLYQN
jgi:hypothetical protein